MLAGTSLAATPDALAGDWHHECRQWIAFWNRPTISWFMARKCGVFGSAFFFSTSCARFKISQSLIQGNLYSPIGPALYAHLRFSCYVFFGANFARPALSTGLWSCHYFVMRNPSCIASEMGKCAEGSLQKLSYMETGWKSCAWLLLGRMWNCIEYVIASLGLAFRVSRARLLRVREEAESGCAPGLRVGPHGLPLFHCQHHSSRRNWGRTHSSSLLR